MLCDSKCKSDMTRILLLQRSEKYPELFPHNESFLHITHHKNLRPATFGQWSTFQPGAEGRV